MSKLVSIVLPTYNGQLFLKQSIASCLNQSYQNIELIIVNDCSTDNTKSIIKSFDDKRIVYIENQENQKLPNSLNIGFKVAKGKYFTWTSDDNYYDINAISEMVNVIESKQVDLVYAPYFTIDDKDHITGYRNVGPKENILLDNIVKACFLYKRDVHEKLIGYNSDLFLVEDYDFWIRAIYNGFSTASIDNKLYYYRFHKNSLTDTRRKEISKSLYNLLFHHYKKFKKEHKNLYITDKFYLRMASLSLANNEIKSFDCFFWKGIRLKPQNIFKFDSFKMAFKRLTIL
jgi:glycosyltransferase involved in cell wall biosynthesis